MFERTIRTSAGAAQMLRADPNIEAYSSSVGGGGMTTSGNTGRLMIRLASREHAIDLVGHGTDGMRLRWRTAIRLATSKDADETPKGLVRNNALRTRQMKKSRPSSCSGRGTVHVRAGIARSSR